jgi:alkylhydroperoxidase family enzyme
MVDYVIEEVPWAHLPRELQDAITAGQETGFLSTTMVHQILAYSPEIAMAHIGQYHAIFTGPLDERLRELVRQRVASFNDCEPCLLALKSDTVTVEDLACLSSSDERFTPRERAALRYAELFVTDHFSIDAELYRELAEHFTKAEIIELGVSCGYYLGAGRLVHTLTALAGQADKVARYEDEFAPQGVA